MGQSESNSTLPDCGSEEVLTRPASTEPVAAPDTTYTLSQLALAAGTTVHMVNNYATEDLIACCARTAAGYRRFDATALARLRFIRTGRAAGFLLSDLKPLLQALDRGEAAGIARSLADLKAAVDEAAERLAVFERVAEQLGEESRVDESYPLPRRLP